VDNDAAGFVFSVDFGNGTINRSRLSGSQPETLIDLKTLLGSAFRTREIAVDMAGGKIYWTVSDAATVMAIQRADLDGSNVETLISAPYTYGGFRGIALDAAAGKMYWIDLRLDDRLGRLFDSMDVCQSVLKSFFVRPAAGPYDLDDSSQLVRLLVSMARNELASEAHKQHRQKRDQRRAVGDELALEAPGGGVAEPGGRRSPATGCPRRPRPAPTRPSAAGRSGRCPCSARSGTRRRRCP
jgi:hypothetical protein